MVQGVFSLGKVLISILDFDDIIKMSLSREIIVNQNFGPAITHVSSFRGCEL